MNFFDKISNFLIKDDSEDDIRTESQPQFFETQRTSISDPSKQDKKATRKSNLITVPTKGKNSDNLEIVLFKATSYDDMQEIARHIKEHKVAVVNFEDMDKAVAQRMVDFLSGAAFALDGVPRKVSGGTFIFSCSQVDMNGQIMGKGNEIQGQTDRDDKFSMSQWLNS